MAPSSEVRQLVYVETTVVSYLTARPSRDLIVAAHQEITRTWWDDRRGTFHLVVSELVILEASSGDPDAAARRIAAISELPLVSATDEGRELARSLIAAGAVPPNAPEDALHIALAATAGAHFLLTWNCKHIANASHRAEIERVCRAHGFLPPAVCTPLELLEA